jgi:hypothetical protein
MSRPLLGAASRLVARVSASRFAKPGARVALIAMGLACLAAIGRGCGRDSGGGACGGDVRVRRSAKRSNSNGVAGSIFARCSLSRCDREPADVAGPRLARRSGLPELGGDRRSTAASWHR